MSLESEAEINSHSNLSPLSWIPFPAKLHVSKSCTLKEDTLFPVTVMSSAL